MRKSPTTASADARLLSDINNAPVIAEMRAAARDWQAIVRRPNKGEPNGTTMVRTNSGNQAICCEQSGKNFAESASFAYLVAAAPDMLEALQDIVKEAAATRMMLPPDLADSIRVFGMAAIKKATGGAP